MNWMELLAQGIAKHQVGQLAEAEVLYRQVLDAEPTNVAAWHLLGRLAWDAKQPEVAVSCLRQALATNPAYAECRVDLGYFLEVLGNDREAEQEYSQAADQRPDHVEAHFNLANLLRARGEYDRAIESYERVLALKPEFAGAHMNLGVALEKQGRRIEAIACYWRACELEPTSSQIHVNLATALRHSDHPVAAVSHLEQAIALAPAVAANHNLLGTWHFADGHKADAIKCFEAAIAGNSEYADAWANLASVFRDAGQLERAAAIYDRALQLRPDCVRARLNRAWLWLITGDFERGWPELEWRLKMLSAESIVIRPFTGGSLAGRNVLIHQEQGYGDTFQFARYLPLLKARGAKVYFECPRSLHPLLSCLDIDGLLGIGELPAHFDVQFPLLSLPGVFQTRLESIPANVPYLRAAPELVDRWRERLRGIAGFKVGVAWQGNRSYIDDRERSIPLSEFGPLASIPNVQLLSLQKGYGTEQLHQKRSFSVYEAASDVDLSGGAFMDTAAIMQQLDLVITSDTAVAHLAGALGVHVWVALPFTPDWRWLLHRADSPWYPTMRLFRQSSAGDWRGVFRHIEAELRDLVKSRST